MARLDADPPLHTGRHCAKLGHAASSRLRLKADIPTYGFDAEGVRA
jgi:hypothetical protein